jgi:transcriptional regulator with XRE-family HTH domain
VALLGIIRRWHIRDQVPLREIARRLGISRNTVRRYLRSETVEPTYSERRSTRAIDKYAFQLSALLKTEAARSRKQRRTLKQIHEDLKELGFEGSYDRVAAFARTWREGQTERVNPSSKRTFNTYSEPLSRKARSHASTISEERNATVLLEIFRSERRGVAFIAIKCATNLMP